MPNTLPYIFEGSEIRVLMRDTQPWFIAADVCRTLNIQNPTKAVSALDSDEKAILKLGLSGGDTNIISESGLYTLILRSRDATKPGTLAHRFRKWVTGEVIPSIRKTGSYVGGVRRHTEAATPGKVRYAKLQLAWAVARLDALGVNVASIDMNAVVNFSRAVLR